MAARRRVIQIKRVVPIPDAWIMDVHAATGTIQNNPTGSTAHRLEVIIIFRQIS